MTEADLKRTVRDYLEILKKQGRIWFARLNSGDIFPKYKGRYYKIELCEEGTADYIVIQSMTLKPKGCWVTFLELKAPKGNQSDKQKEFQAIVEAQGAEYLLAKSIDEVVEALE